MTETREFTKEEFYNLLEHCPEEEADGLIKYCRQIGKLPWEFFEDLKVGTWGILIDEVPTYFACLYIMDDVYRMWTLHRSEIKEQFTLFKLCKRKLDEVRKQYGPIYTINYVKNKLEAKWNMRLGFLPYKVEDDLVYYKMEA